MSPEKEHLPSEDGNWIAEQLFSDLFLLPYMMDGILTHGAILLQYTGKVQFSVVIVFKEVF
jgi:hypothetical protein